jgi:hypothetical protein
MSKQPKDRRIVHPKLAFSEYNELYEAILNNIVKGDKAQQDVVKKVIKNHFIHDLYNYYNADEDRLAIEGRKSPAKFKLLNNVVKYSFIEFIVL